jgi:cell division protein FtsX
MMEVLRALRNALLVIICLTLIGMLIALVASQADVRRYLRVRQM